MQCLQIGSASAFPSCASAIHFFKGKLAFLVFWFPMGTRKCRIIRGSLKQCLRHFNCTRVLQRPWMDFPKNFRNAPAGIMGHAVSCINSLSRPYRCCCISVLYVRSLIKKTDMPASLLKPATSGTCTGRARWHTVYEGDYSENWMVDVPAWGSLH